ncbi:hypothetical protein [Microcoleus sp. N3A4]|uniref:hypothetical protein n=1 Tax=Microcoleus sp. N3A4 TaxID=3055379 RepID=UPI002FD4D889
MGSVRISGMFDRNTTDGKPASTKATQQASTNRHSAYRALYSFFDVWHDKDNNRQSS